MCEKEFDKPDDLAIHVRNTHTTSFSDEQLFAIVSMFETRVKDPTKNGICPFCPQKLSLTEVRLGRHIADHLAQVALFVLPRASQGNAESSEGEEYEPDDEPESTSKTLASPALINNETENESTKSTQDPILRQVPEYGILVLSTPVQRPKAE
jgi:hypothetical protein